MEQISKESRDYEIIEKALTDYFKESSYCYRAVKIALEDLLRSYAKLAEDYTASSSMSDILRY